MLRMKLLTLGILKKKIFRLLSLNRNFEKKSLFLCHQ